MEISDRDLGFVIVVGSLFGSVVGAGLAIGVAFLLDRFRRYREARRIDWQGPDD